MKSLKQFKKKKELLNRSLLGTITVFSFFILANYPRFSLGTYNLEWVFLDLSNYFRGLESLIDIRSFKLIQQNTSFYSNLLSILGLNFANHLLIYRLLNLILVFCFIISLVNIMKYYEIKNYNIISLTILISPYFSTFSNNLTPDFISCLFFIIFFNLIIRDYNKLIASFFIVFSVMLKPVAIMQAAILLSRKNFFNLKKLFQLFMILLISLIILFIYIEYYDQAIIGQNFDKLYNISLSNFLSNNIKYFSHIIFFSGVSSIYIFIQNYLKLNKKNLKKFFYYTFLSCFFLYFINLEYGEVSIGFLQPLLFSKSVKLLFHFTLFILFLFTTDFIFFNNSININIKILYFFLIVSVVIISFIIPRPAIRYLIYVMPLFYICYFHIMNNKKVLVLNLFLFLILNTLQGIYFFNKDKTENKILNYLNEEKIFNQTNPGLIYHSKGFLFNQFTIKKYKENYNYNYKFVVNNCNNDKKIKKRFSVKILNYKIKEICILRK